MRDPNTWRLWKRTKRSDHSKGAASEVRHIDPAGYILPPFKTHAHIPAPQASPLKRKAAKAERTWKRKFRVKLAPPS